MTDFSENGYGHGAAAVALQSDRKIVAFGMSNNPPLGDPHECHGGGDATIVRYLPNGRLDGRFGSGGKVVGKLQEASNGRSQAPSSRAGRSSRWAPATAPR